MSPLKHTLLLFTSLLSLLAPFTNASIASPLPQRSPKSYPLRTIAGVSVIDTPLVRAAESYARANGSPFVYKHIMRSWLFGTLILQHNATLRSTVDAEVHAVAAILHDLGWDQTPNSPLISPDRRFEVDGAIAARDFIRGHKHGQKWDERRVQLVWDAIALHTERSIAYYKEDDVQVVSKGIGMDFLGPDSSLGITKEEYDAVVREFPKGDFKAGVNETLIWLCAGKSATTYDTWMQPWGDHYVANYSAEGKRTFDVLFANL